MSNYIGFKKFISDSKKRRSKSKISYHVIDRKIVIGKKKYTLSSLYILAYLVEFFSLDVCIMGLIRLFYYESLGGIIYSMIGALLFYIGLNYRKIATEVKVNNKI